MRTRCLKKLIVEWEKHVHNYEHLTEEDKNYTDSNNIYRIKELADMGIYPYNYDQELHSYIHGTYCGYIDICYSGLSIRTFGGPVWFKGCTVEFFIHAIFVLHMKKRKLL